MSYGGERRTHDALGAIFFQTVLLQGLVDWLKARGWNGKKGWPPA